MIRFVMSATFIIMVFKNLLANYAKAKIVKVVK